MSDASSTPRVGPFRHVIMTIVLIGVIGCPPPDASLAAANAPPRDLRQILSTISANGRRLDRAVWSSNVSVNVRLTDRKGKEHRYSLESSLLFRPPRSLRMDLRHGLGEQVMQIGSNNDEYWMWIDPELHVMRWGKHIHVGKPCAERMAIRPDQLTAMIGLAPLPSEGSGLTGPTLVRGNNVDKLIFKSAATQRIDREYWIDRTEPYLIKLVLFRDAAGRRTMSAYLDQYKPAWDGGPIVPHVVNIEWPLDKASFTMSIGRLQTKTDKQVNRQAFVRPDRATLPASIKEIEQVDANCDRK